MEKVETILITITTHEDGKQSLTYTTSVLGAVTLVGVFEACRVMALGNILNPFTPEPQSE